MAIPISTHHNEVAPAQYETAPIYEKTTLAADHNLLLMEIMHKMADQHGLACLFHEKPFQRFNGSGKHCNWSLATDSGLNLLHPKENSFHFLVILTAILRAVHQHAALLRASIGSAHNDWRIGGFEAPPSIISVYLGETLEGLVERIIHERSGGIDLCHTIDIHLSNINTFSSDECDRNRTSFFAFNHDRFEFRAVGASQNVAWPMTVINAIVADSLQLILDEIPDAVSGHRKEDLLVSALPILRKHLQRISSHYLFGRQLYARVAKGGRKTLASELSKMRPFLRRFARFKNRTGVSRDFICG